MKPILGFAVEGPAPSGPPGVLYTAREVHDDLGAAPAGTAQPFRSRRT
jgi:hypothetical protein